MSDEPTTTANNSVALFIEGPDDFKLQMIPTEDKSGCYALLLRTIGGQYVPVTLTKKGLKAMAKALDKEWRKCKSK